MIDEEKGGKRCEKTIVADQALANALAYSEFCRVVTLQVAPGYRNHIVRSGRVEGDSLCYVVLALNDLAPDRVDSRTGKWGQTRKLRDRTESAVRQRFHLACDARTCAAGKPPTHHRQETHHCLFHPIHLSRAHRLRAGSRRPGSLRAAECSCAATVPRRRYVGPGWCPKMSLAKPRAGGGAEPCARADGRSLARGEEHVISL